MDLILASASPRRADLLKQADIPHTVRPSDADESMNPELSPWENARVVAMSKAVAVANIYPDNPVLAADTIVVLDGEIIGKPADELSAEGMLSKLSGCTHIVCTGVALIQKSNGVQLSMIEKTSVYFKNITHEAIREYVATGEPMDKAGAYAIQGGACDWVERYEGSYTNIIGLPMEKVTQMLRELKCR